MRRLNDKLTHRLLTLFTAVGGFVRGVVLSLCLPAAFTGLRRPGSSCVLSATFTASGIGNLLTAAASGNYQVLLNRVEIINILTEQIRKDSRQKGVYSRNA